ncbi:PorV/PorQ family protein [Ferruginibacter paludis]|uniref:putative type IX sorting system protein PorV2 n=1 Tax=Ferruginibacter paludis TaxID=1310417 RepID=UPI0025B59A8A|nr:PorV/PorQ family protein [Ferruginibacter paludis]MDN3655814.1 PorV/PorQ family protein [Ferruginibacter paludis]
MSSKLATFLLSTVLFPIASFSQFRKYSNEFLNIGAGARGLAMGSAQVASVQDGTAGYWNPAGLAGVKDHPEVNLMHAEYFAGIGKYDFGSVAIPIQDNKRTIGVSLLRFAVDDIPNTLFLVQPDGSVDYGSITSFSSADYAMLFSYAQKVVETEDKLVSFGVNAKVIHRKVGQFATAWGFGIDAGVQMHGKQWHLGLVAKDLTTTFNAWAFTFTDKEKQVLYLTKNDIPVRSTELTSPRLTLGGGYDFQFSPSFSLLAEANLDLTFDGKRNTVISSNPVSVDPHLGLEANIKGVFFIRAGVTNFQKALSDGDTLNQKKVWIYQPSLGAGVKIKNVTLDYAYSNLANQSNPLYTHIFSLRFTLVKREKE